MKKNVIEICEACELLDINYEVLPIDEAINLISRVSKEFNIQKLNGHLAINTDDSISIPLEVNEYVYSNNLFLEPAFLFFDQENQNKGTVIKIENAQKICSIMEESFGMEYFVTNESFSYLLAVNWYAIEGVGNAKEWMSKLL